MGPFCLSPNEMADFWKPSRVVQGSLWQREEPRVDEARFPPCCLSLGPEATLQGLRFPGDLVLGALGILFYLVSLCFSQFLQPHTATLHRCRCLSKPVSPSEVGVTVPTLQVTSSLLPV